MTLNAGQAPTAATLLHLQPVTYSAVQTGNAGSQQAVTTTETDCLGCSVTFTTATAANCLLVANFDLDASVAGATVAVGRVRVDGVTITAPEAHLSGASVTRSTAGQNWTFALSGAGSHTVLLRVLKSAAAATVNCVDLHTRFSLIVTEVV